MHHDNATISSARLTMKHILKCTQDFGKPGLLKFPLPTLVEGGRTEEDDMYHKF